MSFVDSDVPRPPTLRLHMDAGARQGERLLSALILRLAADHGLLDVLTFIAPLDGESRPESSDTTQSLTIEIRGDEMRLRSFAASLTNLAGIVLATLDRKEVLFGSR